MTNDVVRTKGKDAAEEVRKLGDKAKQTGLDLAKYAEDVAHAIEEASERVASSIERYLEHCATSTESIAKQRDTLSDIPPAPAPAAKEGKSQYPAPRTNSARPTREQGLTAVEHALDHVLSKAE